MAERFRFPEERLEMYRCFLKFKCSHGQKLVTADFLGLLSFFRAGPAFCVGEGDCEALREGHIAGEFFSAIAPNLDLTDKVTVLRDNL